MRKIALIALTVAAFSGGAALAQDNMSAPAPAAPQASPENPLSGFPVRPHRGGGRRLAGVQTACASDFATLCPGMTPGDGKLGPCLRANRTKLSKMCGDALGALRARQVPGEMPLPKPTPTAPQ